MAILSMSGLGDTLVGREGRKTSRWQNEAPAELAASDVPSFSRSQVAGVWSCYGIGGELESVFGRGEHAER